MIIARFLIVLSVLLAMLPSAMAHEFDPAFLGLEERAEGGFAATWKVPLQNDTPLALEPSFPEGCLPLNTRGPLRRGDAFIRWFDLACPLDDGMLEIAGLERTRTDVLIRLKRLGGAVETQRLTPRAPGWSLGDATSTSVPAYLWIGVEHIWFGPDHLLFVLGLLFLVPVRRLLGVITAFTLAHSITLGVAALGVFTLPGRPVEILIAMSIALLGVEVTRVRMGRASLAARKPWMISFGIGLIHGFGFAGALGEIGLPKEAVLAALMLFNLGVELGQVLFVLAVLGLGAILRRSGGAPERLALPAIYAIGTIGVFWTLERVLV